METLAGFASTRAFTYFLEDYPFQKYDFGMVDLINKTTLRLSAHIFTAAGTAILVT